ncbi:MAG: hypothetical protein ACREN5_04940 [Gemmatimonadales bacterium]
MPLSKVFRGFLIGDAVLTSATILIGVAATDGGHDQSSEALLYTVVSVAILIAWIAALAGLWRFRGWARILYLALAGVGVLGTLFAGGEVAGGLAPALRSLCWLVTGAVIALAYWSPLAARFRPE